VLRTQILGIAFFETGAFALVVVAKEFARVEDPRDGGRLFFTDAIHGNLLRRWGRGGGSAPNSVRLYPL
jgi:hypothetical protein